MLRISKAAICLWLPIARRSRTAISIAISCAKLDGVDYTEKLAQIIAENNVRSVRVARMQVPCCGGLEQAVRRAVAIAGSQNGAGTAGAVVGAGGVDITGGAVDAVGAVASSIPVQIDVISSDGRIVAVG